jgi:SAM-dependent methyltransferase
MALVSVPMTSEEQTTPTARSAELLQRGPAPFETSRRRRLRLAVRSGVLRLIRPYTFYQRELDAEVVAALRRQEAALDRHEAELERVRTRHADQIEWLEKLVRELIFTSESLRRTAVETAARGEVALEQAIEQSVGSIEEELHAVPYVDKSPFERFDSPVGEVFGFQSRTSQGEATSESEGISEYVAFEELFRGPAERVVASQRPYLDLIRGHEPVLDVGCGRGEFLALLAGEGIDASGVDSDAGMVERCRALGVRAVHGDANEYLESLPDGTLGTIFSAQVIEHLRYDELRRLLALARRKLRAGGLLIAETVNPHRMASFKTFWVDLTHEHPIFPEVALALCGIAGFEQAYVFAPGFNSFETARFEAPSYAVAATAPEP